jgi:TonB family protein
MMMNKKPAPATTTTATQANAAAPVTPPKPKIVLQPVVANASPQTTTAATSSADQQKAFELAVQQKYEEQLLKMQSDFTAKLKQTQSKNAPVQTAASAPASSASQPDPSAAALDASKREAAAAQPVAPPTATQAAAQPAVAQPQPTAPAPAPAQVAAVREGDVIDVNELDTIPKALGAIRPVYSLIAQRQHVEGTVLLTALISETGQVLDVRVLKGVGYGLDESAARAMKTTRFSAPIKDGKRVKTWFPQAITFKL